MSPRPPEFDYRGFDKESLFGPEHVDAPPAYPGPYQRDVLPGKVAAREQTFDTKDAQAQTSPMMERDAAGMNHYAPDLERRQVTDITRAAAIAASKIHSPRTKRSRRTIGDGIQQPSAAKDVQVPRSRTPAEAKDSSDNFAIGMAKALQAEHQDQSSQAS